MFDTIWKGITSVFSSADSLIDNVSTTDEERLELRNGLEKIKSDLTKNILDAEVKIARMQSEIITAEANGESWLQRNWRPVLMLMIMFIIFNNYIFFPYASMFTDLVIQLELPEWLGDLMKIGVGGYIITRGGEKMVKQHKEK